MVKIFHGDCKAILPTLTNVTAIVSDPPYGCANDCNYQRFSGGLSPSRNFHHGIPGDQAPFDPTHLLGYPHVALFGYQFFARHLPVGTILVWNKKRDSQLGTFLSDAELCWLNKGKGVYLCNHTWHGFDRASERGRTLHPTQKPVFIMKWVITRMKLPPGTTICDPYCGSGATGLAARELGYPFIGIEIDPTYHEIATKRLGITN